MSVEDQILAELRTLNQTVSKNTGFSSGANTGTQIAQQLTAGTTNFIGSVGKAATGAYDLNAAIKDTTAFLGVFGTVGQSIGAIFGAAASEVKNMNDSMITASRSGVGFSQNLFYFTRMMAEAGIKFSDFNTLLQTSNRQIVGYGQNAQQSAEMFLLASAALRNSREVMRLELQGIDFKEFQQTLIETQGMMKFVDGDRARLNRVMAESTINVITEIDNMARITGKSRQEIQKGIETANQNRVVQVAMMSMTEEQRVALQRMNPFITQYGKGFQDLYQELFVFKGKTVTRESGEMMGGLATLAPNLHKVMLDMSQTTDKNEQERLKRQFEFELAKVSNDQKFMEQFNILATRQEPWAVKLTDFLISSQNANAGAVERFRKAEGSFEKYAQITENIFAERKAIQDNILNLKQQGGSGAVVSQILLGLDRAIGAGQTAVGRYIADLEKTTGQKIGSHDIKDVEKHILGLQNKSKEDLEQWVKGLTGWVGENPHDTSPGNVPNIDRYKNMRLEYTSQDPLPVRDVGRPREGGTKGTSDSTKISKWFENFGDGTPLTAHGQEGIIRADQSLEFAMDTLKETGILAPLAAGLKNSLAESKGQVSNSDAIKDLIAAVNTIPKQLNIPNTPSTVVGKSDEEILEVLLDRLNSKMDKLITAVEDGSRGTVRAVKAGNNMIG